MEWSDFLHAGANSGKLKIYFTDIWVTVVNIKCGHLFSLQDTKICPALRQIVWIELIFCMITVTQ